MEGRSSSNNNSYNLNLSWSNQGLATSQGPPTATSCSNQNGADPRPSVRPLAPPSSLTYREQDRYLPIANLVRIMRRALPPNAKISDEAKETVQECVSEFIAFVTEEANEKCRQEHRKTITGDDLVCSMETLGFDNYVKPLKIYLNKYRQQDVVGLGKSEMASHQRRQANRAIGIQIRGSSTSHRPIAARIGVGSVGVGGVMPSSNPTLMPPLTMVNPQHGMLNPHANHGYLTHGGLGTNSGLNAGFNSAAAAGEDGDLGSNQNPNPSASFNHGGGNNDEVGGLDMPDLSTPTSSESDPEMSFYDLLNQYK